MRRPVGPIQVLAWYVLCETRMHFGDSNAVGQCLYVKRFCRMKSCEKVAAKPTVQALRFGRHDVHAIWGERGVRVGTLINRRVETADSFLSWAMVIYPRGTKDGYQP